MFEFGNKEFRNLQEQVEKNQEDIKALKTGIKVSFWVNATTDLPELLVEDNYGKYVVVGSTGSQKLYVLTKRANGGWLALNLGDYPLKGEQGDTGEQGIQGLVGPTGHGIFGVSHILPSAGDYTLGDFFLLDTGALYKCISNYEGNNSWQLQCSLKGPQGIQGLDGDEVTANPSGPVTEHLSKIKIDGVIYDFPSLNEADREMLDNLEEYIEFDEDGNVTFGGSIYVDGSITTNGIVSDGDVEITDADLKIDNINKITSQNGTPIAQGKLTAGDNINISGQNIIKVDGISNPNLLINGDFKINQRGETSYTGSNIYTADRWNIGNGTFNYSTKTWTPTSQYGAIVQKIEDISYLKGKTVTLSIKVTSATENMFDILINDGSNHRSGTAISSSGEIKKYTYTISATATQLRIGIIYLGTSTTNSVSIEWAKLEIGSVATPFVPRTIAEELLMCQRYYYKLGLKANTAIGAGVVRDTTSIRAILTLPVEMRTTPTLSSTSLYFITNGNHNMASIVIGLFNKNSVYINGAFATSVSTSLVGYGGILSTNGNTGYVALDAEIY